MRSDKNNIMKSIFLSTQTTYLLSKEKSNPFAQTVLKNHAFKKWRRNFLCHCCLQRYIVIVNAKTLKRNFFSLIFLILWIIRCHILVTFPFCRKKIHFIHHPKSIFQNNNCIIQEFYLSKL